MCDDGHGHARRRQVLHDLQDLAHQLWVKRGGRLIKEHDFRLHRQRAGNRHTLLLPAREFCRIVIRAIRQPHSIKELQGLNASFLLRTLQHLDRSFHHVLQSCHVREQVEALEHHADAGTLRGDLLVVAFKEHAVRILSIAQQFAIDVYASRADTLQHI